MHVLGATLTPLCGVATSILMVPEASRGAVRVVLYVWCCTVVLDMCRNVRSTVCVLFV
jgi:hypothetical protein